jgi:hypothetical protein
MHLSLIDVTFVLNNLISTQKSPVPLLKFQMALRLKILMASGSKKGTQMYFSFPLKIPVNETLQVPQEGPYVKGGPFTRRSAYLSKTSPLGSPVKEPSSR